MSVAIENFVKAIYKNKHQEHKDTKPGTIAKVLGISSAAATDMAKKLAAKNVLSYKKYQELQLTEKGTKMALSVIRKHRLWEALLFQLFDMSLHDIHREAELLEHQTSDFLAEQINTYLDYPEFDPHGDPIPNSEGKINTVSNSIALASAQAGQSYIISRLMSDDKEFFDFCSQHHLKYRNTITVDKQFQNTKMTQITVNDNIILLNQDFTTLIYVKPNNQKNESS